VVEAEHDVLIVGAGCAGMRAAIEAHDAGADVALLSGDGQTVLATGSGSSSGGKSLEHRVCGARSVKVHVARGGAAARFTLRVVVP
jgi:succinate dehydrogenase/fumarate reductase flavoprotein subunit